MNLLVFGNTSKDAAWEPVQQALCRQEALSTHCTGRRFTKGVGDFGHHCLGTTTLGPIWLKSK